MRFLAAMQLLPSSAAAQHAGPAAADLHASAPLGINTPGKPNVASTIWRTVHDQKDRTLYFDSATSPTVFWVPLDKVDLSAGAPVKRLALKGGETYSGDASASLRPAEPFKFLEAKPQ